MANRFSGYEDSDAIAAAVAAGLHRDMVGGLWDEIGSLQFGLLRERGLLPRHRLLDIGCGSLRGGVHFVRYLDPANYYGLDRNGSLLDAGYEQELVPLGLDHRLPRDHLQVDAGFDAARFGVRFDRAVGFSLFTHLPLDLARVCLERLALAMAPGGIFYATFFEAAPDHPTHLDIVHEPAGIVSHGGADPFHHRFADFVHLASGLPWDVDYIGDFGHPRGQRLISFTRREDFAGGVSEETRRLPVGEVGRLSAGDDHYRAYVGPVERYDMIGASQFALLFQLGLRDRHRVLDFGCGSLRLGRMLIPFLRQGGYFGIDPNRWLIEDGIDRELGRSALALKQPRFAYNDDFNCDVFGADFEFVVAQSIVTHTGPDLFRKFLSSAAQALDRTGIIVFSYIRGAEGDALPADGWHYPHCVGYSETALAGLLGEFGLHGAPLPWFHPGATWHMASLAEENLPSAEQRAALTGTIVPARG